MEVPSVLVLCSNVGGLLGATAWWFCPWVRLSSSAGVEGPSVLVSFRGRMRSCPCGVLLGDLSVVIVSVQCTGVRAPRPGDSPLSRAGIKSDAS